MHRFFLESLLADTVYIYGEDAHHITRVLRLSPGDTIEIVGRDGEAALGSIASADPKEVEVQLRARLAGSHEPSVEVILAQGLPKGDKMDFIIQKTVELGVGKIIPWTGQHSVVQYNKDKEAGRVSRWQKIAAEAAKQCKRNRIPAVEPVQTLADILAQADRNTLKIMFYEQERVLGLKQVLSDQKRNSFLLLVGPEGGFSADELNLCRQHNVNVTTLGPRTLRTETAALAGITAVMYECGDLGG
ncbi:16S rRNA (uracil(1498)-N(3))-methyltransferase [Acetonema longum]|uniref:Ribosomal RNA small subunit methyltransferase E n=1 Tax=Acetonema longum DSM 6540 TaxID=1009370 RepID=F7NKW6_9FIRM|nr:16S rRNA (uracil(1498)-N(3))-methyltransferase [Acetonema longum]EGO63309.1 hypothetical protein ALO_13674 [Acetonema longum DSM 6540]